MLAEGEVTQLIRQYQRGDDTSANALYTLVYQELHRIASQQLRRSWSVDTIQTTSLVSEAYLKLIDQNQCNASDRAHFFALSAKAMRQIIINYAEQKQAKKRGGDWHQTTFSDAESIEEIHFDNAVLVDRALKQLAEIDSNLCQLVELRFFAGMSEAQIAQVMNVTDRTVRRNWRKAKALLSQIMEAEHME